LRTAVNLWIVFFLCGLWHGAGLTFIVWGLYHGFLLTAERVLDTRLGWRLKGVPGIALTFGLVTVGWVFFRAPNLPVATHYLATMFLLRGPSGNLMPVAAYVTPDIEAYLAAALIFAFVPFERLGRLRFDRPIALAGQLSLSGASLAAACRQQLQPLHLLSLLTAAQRRDSALCPAALLYRQSFGRDRKWRNSA
jgi:hypothetical protein